MIRVWSCVLRLDICTGVEEEAEAPDVQLLTRTSGGLGTIHKLSARAVRARRCWFPHLRYTLAPIFVQTSLARHRLLQLCGKHDTARPFSASLLLSSTHIMPIVLMTGYEVSKDFVRESSANAVRSRANANRTLAQSTLSHVDLSAPLLLRLCSQDASRRRLVIRRCTKGLVSLLTPQEPQL